MDKLARLGRLHRLIREAGGAIDGRKKLHKLAYLCQRAGTDLGQTFVFHMFGVYSPSLAQDMQAAERWNFVSETPRGVDGYMIRLGAEEPDQDTTLTEQSSGFALVQALKGEASAVLEVMTTIVYLWDAGYRDQDLEQKLYQLKGHLSVYFAEAASLVCLHFPSIKVTLLTR